MAAVERKTEHVKILQDLGYDPWEIENDDDMLSALKASINDLSRENPGDGRIPMLQDAVKGLRRPKFAAKEKETTVTGKNVNKAKLLPGTTFRPQDIKPDNEAEMAEDGAKKDDIIAFLNGDVKDKLEEINQSVIEIKGVVVSQGELAEDRDEELRKSILAAKKKKRESDLEKKKKGMKDKLLEPITKPVGNFLNKLIKFVMMTFVGSVINRVITLLKDPAQLLDPIKRFFNFAIGLVNAVMKGLWNITGAPMNFIIGGINKGVSALLDALNKATGLLKIPPIKAPQIPLIPGPPEFPFIPLSKTAQAKNEAVGMSGGGVVPGGDGMDGDMGLSGVDGESGVDGVDGMASIGMDGIDGVDGMGAVGLDGVDGMGSVGLDGVNGKGSAGLDGVDGVSPNAKRQGFGGGGYAAPYPTNNLLGMGHNVINTAPNNIMGYNKGGKVPGSGTGDTVPAMLTPGEFVMSKGAVDQIGVDKLMAMNKEGGGTNKPTLMKFAGGGMVPGINPPSGRGGKVIMVGGGGKSSSSTVVTTSGGEDVPSFSSTDPNNVTTSVVKSLYNMMG